MTHDSSMLMLMDPNQIPPIPPQAPPPYQPVTKNHDPYAFITNPPPQPKKKLISGDTSKKTRLMIVICGGLVLIMVLIILYGLIFSSGGQKVDYLSLVQQQTELVRISDIGVQKARGAEAKNLAITTKYSLISQQAPAQQLAQKAGVDTSNKSLILGKDAKTDAKLVAAEQTNQFDSVFMATIQTSLKKYQQTLKTIRDGTSSTATKATLTQYHTAIGNLLPAQSNKTTPASVP